MADQNRQPPSLRLQRPDTNQSSTAPTRANTDPAESQKQERHHHLPRRLHANSLGGRRNHHYRRDARDTAHSAIELKPPISFEHFLRRDKKTTPDSSRRSSGPHAHNGTIPESDVEHIVQRQIKLERAARRHVTAEDVAREHRRNERREDELRANLRELEEQGMDNTRQLDETYYMILEKASILRSTVASLQELVDQSRKMHQTFRTDADALQRETEQSLDQWGNFEQQEKTMNQLLDRLKGSRTNTDRLNDRLESTRKRMDAYDQRQRKRQMVARQRWQIAWAVLAAFVALLVAIFVARHRQDVGGALQGVTHIVGSPLPAFLRSHEEVDPYLEKMFDNL